MERIFGDGSVYSEHTRNELKKVMLVPEIPYSFLLPAKAPSTERQVRHKSTGATLPAGSLDIWKKKNIFTS